jgi:hypothetical protein
VTATKILFLQRLMWDRWPEWPLSSLFGSQV